MIQDQKILREFTLLERKGVYSVTHRLKNMDVDLNSQIAETQRFLKEVTEKVSEGRKATLRCLSQVYFVVATAYRSEDDFHALWKALSIKASYKRRKKPLILIIQGLLGADAKQASKWSQVIKLGFLSRVLPDDFFDHIDSLGGIEKAAEAHRVLKKSSKRESGREDDETVETGMLRYAEDGKAEVRKPGDTEGEQQTYPHDDREQPSIGTTDAARSDNSGSAPQKAKAHEVAGLSPSGVKGKGWAALSKAIARAASHRRTIRKIIEIEIRPTGKVNLKKIVTEKEIARRVTQFNTLSASLMKRALAIADSRGVKGTRNSSTATTRRMRRI